MSLFLLIIGGIATAIFVVSRVIGAARDGREAIDDVKGAVRRGNWSRQIDQRVIESLNDPRDSAAILMVQIASYEGEITTAQKEKMVALMTDCFGATADEAEGLYSFGRMAIGQINDAANSMGKLMRPVKASLTLDEMKDMIRMMEEISEVEGAPSERQRELIMQVRRSLSLDKAYQG